MKATGAIRYHSSYTAEDRGQEMVSTYNVAVVGATGLVGQEFLKIAAQRHFPIKGLRLLASHRSAGRKLTIGEWAVEVEEATPKSFQGIDLAFFSAKATPDDSPRDFRMAGG